MCGVRAFYDSKNVECFKVAEKEKIIAHGLLLCFSLVQFELKSIDYRLMKINLKTNIMKNVKRYECR